MSFSTQVKQELNSIHKKGNCCKKAYILGAIMSAKIDEDNSLMLTLTDQSTKDELCFMLKLIFKIEPIVKEIKRGCFCATELTFKSLKLVEFLRLADRSDGNDEIYKDILNQLKCEGCKSAFLRAIFASCGSVSDPHKSFTLEIRLPNIERASLVKQIIESIGISTPNLTERRGNIGLFYRNEAGIEEFLTLCGANHALFSFFDIHIEKDIRNAENRATNCVTKNILRSVEATSLQISAIEALMANSMFEELSRELKATARLRLENQEATLSELALLHQPAISKSGLNHRLSKIIEEAKKRRLI